MYALVENDQVVEWPITNLYEKYPNVSFPAGVIANDDLPEGIVYVNYLNMPTHNWVVEKITPESKPEFRNNRWEIGYLVVPLSSSEQQDNEIIKAQNIRQERNAKLKESDWTQIADAPVDKAQWAAYRQELRDITSMPEFPLNVVWPEPPNT